MQVQDVIEIQNVVSLKKNQSVSYDVKISPYQVSEEDLDAVEYCLDPVQVAIARFSEEEIRGMNHVELVELNTLSGVFSSREMNSQRFMEHDEVQKMSFLARRLCRHEVNAAYQRRGREVPYFET